LIVEFNELVRPPKLPAPVKKLQRTSMYKLRVGRVLVPGGRPESYRCLMPEYPPRRRAKLRIKRIRGPCESTILPQIGAVVYTPAEEKKNIKI
jgi:hypothetical protein